MSHTWLHTHKPKNDSEMLAYRSGSMMMRQLHFAMLDLELHARFMPGGKETVFDVDHRIAEKTMVMKPLSEDR